MGKERILGPLDLFIPEGQCVAVLGPSGSGKSTFLRVINRLLPPEARLRGTVRIGGRRLPADQHLPQLRRACAMVLQRPVAFPGTVADNIRLVRRAHGLSASEEVVGRLLASVGLPRGIERRSAETLSGGELQRLAIARVLALEPGVLLLDEPTSALDPLTTRTVEEALLPLRGRLTMLWVTHSLPQAIRVAERLLVFWAGSCIGDGTLAALRQRDDPRLRSLLE